mmetsp:Transcript_94445/g.243933  ORF Transcript_94445/g.243933 Transcript_94445/m.243933 type:complete len:232 (-) Transcript_94445:1450-2145(-)
MSSLEKRGWSGLSGSTAAPPFFDAALVLASGFALGLAASFAASLAASLISFAAPTSSLATSSCSKRIDPVETGLPAFRFMKSFESLGMAMGSTPSFLKIASAAVGMKAAKKCASTYTASRSRRSELSRFVFSASSFIFHGSKSAIHLLVAAQARTVRSAASASLKDSKAERTETLSSSSLKGGGTRPFWHSGTAPPQSDTARFTRFPRLSHRSELCISRMDCVENFTSSPY